MRGGTGVSPWSVLHACVVRPSRRCAWRIFFQNGMSTETRRTIRPWMRDGGPLVLPALALPRACQRFLVFFRSARGKVLYHRWREPCLVNVEANNSAKK